MFDSYTREQLRRSYIDAWHKHETGAVLTTLEALIVDVIAAHPEYQALMRDPEAAMAHEPGAGAGTESPFLHMGLHLAVREQLSIDRPPGVRELHRQLQAAGSRHDADHALMQALGETLWEAQRSKQAPDTERYLALARRHLQQATYKG